MSTDQQGPSEETFRALAAKLPTFVSKALGPQLSLPAGTNFRKPCKICQKQFGNPHRPSKRECCKTCLALLEDGWCAITCIDGRAQWVRGENFIPAGWAGTVKNFSLEDFEKLLRVVKLVDFVKEKNEAKA